MLSATDNELLTRSGVGTPMGDYFRRFWQPVALSRELPEHDGAPIRLKVLGEELIAIRDSSGRVGLLDPRCAHRGAELFFGRNEEGGIRCIYHGWKYTVDGVCTDMPNVPAGSAYHGNTAIKAYPTREFGDVVWAYLGPPKLMPLEPPGLEFAIVPGAHRFVTKRLQQCNWAQSMEGALDTAHFSFLHMPAPALAKNDTMTAAADEKLPVQTLAELADYARKNPGVPYGSVGIGSSQHLAGAFFEQIAGAPMTHVPYRVTAQLVTDLISGQAPVSFQLVPNVLGQIKSGQVRALAVAGDRRLPALPDVPTTAEAGVKAFVSAAWFAFLAPAGTPRAIIDRLNREIITAIGDPALRARFSELGVEPMASTPEELGRHIKTETIKWREIIGKAGIKLEN